ncbi:MAG: hypothetical protein JW864_12360 [Spirochaetes bacterium]|nr:hypothetical protein [Spirochaetota bacterium]
MTKRESDHKIGKFFVENGVITEEQRQSALELQRDNPDRLIGEILVTQGILSKEDLVMAVQMYMVMYDLLPDHVDEWLDQEEVDLLLEKIEKKK